MPPHTDHTTEPAAVTEGPNPGPAATSGHEPPPSCWKTSTAPGKTLPLILEPTGPHSVDNLCRDLETHAEWVDQQMTSHGAILLRGFDVDSAPDFERVAKALDDDLKNNYLGTSPRDGLTDYVFSASELPGFYPIPQHCEMSFTASPPRKVFFTCLVEPAEGGGETPLVDFRDVYRDLDPAVRRRFEEGGIRIIRNYAPPGPTSRFNLFQLKGWDEMFLTTDKASVEEQSAAEGFEVHWGENDALRLISTQPAVRNHPKTGEPVWHNHVQVFHLSAAPGEYRHIYNLRPTWKHWAVWQFSRALVAVQRARNSSEEQSMHCTYMDGSEIPDEDMDALRAAIWKNLSITPWRRGDIIAIDNHSTAHGRLPYEGPREIAVAWA